MAAMNGTTMEANHAIRFTPPTTMMPSNATMATAETQVGIAHAFSTAVATPFACTPGRKYEVARIIETANTIAYTKANGRALVWL